MSENSKAAAEIASQIEDLLEAKDQEIETLREKLDEARDEITSLEKQIRELETRD
jgi:phage shock protein A